MKTNADPYSLSGPYGIPGPHGLPSMTTKDLPKTFDHDPDKDGLKWFYCRFCLTRYRHGQDKKVYVSRTCPACGAVPV